LEKILVLAQEIEGGKHGDMAERFSPIERGEKILGKANSLELALLLWQGHEMAALKEPNMEDGRPLWEKSPTSKESSRAYKRTVRPLRKSPGIPSWTERKITTGKTTGGSASARAG